MSFAPYQMTDEDRRRREIDRTMILYGRLVGAYAAMGTMLVCAWFQFPLLIARSM